MIPGDLVTITSGPHIGDTGYFAGVAVLTLHEALYGDPRRDYWVVLEDTERPIRMAGSQIEEIPT